MTHPISFNDHVIKTLKHDEGYRQHPYRCTAGRLTIGYGRNLDDSGITQNEAERLLKNDIDAVLCDLDSALPWWRELPQTPKVALVNMCFNMGLPRLLAFKRMLSALEKFHFTEASKEALDSKWARQVGLRAQRCAALIRGDS